MKTYLNRFTVSLCTGAAIILCWLCKPVVAEERIVLLAPAAADIIEKLGASAGVVGVSNSIEDFPFAEKVGTHITPCMECIAVLNPTLIITTAKFDPAQARRMDVKQFIYNPVSLPEVLEAITALSAVIGREQQGRILADSLEVILENLIPVETRPEMFFEVRSDPLTLAGKDTIVSNALEAAGFVNRMRSGRNTLVSEEYVITSFPAYYIYQQGPMNLNPTVPARRRGWKDMDSCVWKVDEKIFSRANTHLFFEIQKLNMVLNSHNPCETGKAQGYGL